MRAFAGALLDLLTEAMEGPFGNRTAARQGGEG